MKVTFFFFFANKILAQANLKAQKSDCESDCPLDICFGYPAVS